MTTSEIYLNILRMYRALARQSAACGTKGTQLMYVDKLWKYRGYSNRVGDIGAALLKCSIRSGQSVDWWFEGVTHPDHIKQWEEEVNKFVIPPPLYKGITECSGINSYVRKHHPDHFLFVDGYWY